ncbi:MAG: hypothetical protein HW396_759 [Candidatus Dadabacteria bacterium]|nr:hypothetical protein [Candidatus Dadabacteria bacterium]
MERPKSGFEESRVSVVIFLLFFAITFLIYYITSEGHPTHYNNFVRLADAFLHGRLYLTENVKWLELAILEGKYYIVPPPMPSILLLPFVAIFGLSTDQTLASIFLGSLNVSLAFLVVRELTKSRSVQLWTTVMFGFGTIHWWLATTGWVWFFSLVTSVTFLFLAIYVTLKGKRPFLAGFFLGASYWSRLPTILSLPFFILMFSDKWLNKSKEKNFFNRINPKPLLHLSLGVGIFVALNCIYNFLRFGTPLDVSYYLIPGLLQEPWYKEGLFDITYIPRHLRVIFAAFPIFLSKPPYVMPSWGGLAIWITTPAFIYALLAGIRNKLAFACWSAIIPIALLDFSHGGTGWIQFGYRYAVSFYPFLFLLTVKGIGDRIRWHHMVLISLGVIVNLWGVLWINKFGWVRW